jgi:hypothetical protein
MAAVIPISKYTEIKETVTNLDTGEYFMDLIVTHHVEKLML